MSTGLAALVAGFLAAVAAASPAAPAAGPAVVGLRVGPIEQDRMVLTMMLGPGAAVECSGQVRGTLTFFGSPSGARASGTLASGPGGCELTTPVSYEAFSSEAIGRARSDALDIHLVGERSGGAKPHPVDWEASVPRAAVQLTESMRVTLRRFTKSPEIHLGGVGLKTTAVDIDVEIFVPVRFNIKVLEARCEVEVNGRNVASGGREKFIVHGGRTNKIRIPVNLNNGAVLSAAGSTLTKGGKVDGKMTGLARLRLPGGDVDFPIELPVKLSLW